MVTLLLNNGTMSVTNEEALKLGLKLNKYSNIHFAACYAYTAKEILNILKDDVGEEINILLPKTETSFLNNQV